MDSKKDIWMENIYGYVRVSSIDQNEDRQMHEWEKKKISLAEVLQTCNTSETTFA